MSTTSEIIRELDNLRESNTVRNFNDVFLATSKRLAKLEADNARLQADNAALREALKPFAAQTLASSLTEEKMIRAARAALKGEST